MSTLVATTTVKVELDRKPTIEDVRRVLDYLRAEGIPDTFEVDIFYGESREYEATVPYEDRRVTREFSVMASRASTEPSA